MARLMTLSRLPRGARGTAMALLFALVVAAPAAAAQPTLTVFSPHDHTDYAGTACAFDVHFHILPGGWDADTVFGDGRYVRIAHVDVLVTNVATGATFIHKAMFHSTDWYDPATNLYTEITNGQVLVQFQPGDVGPFGVVQYPGALLRFVGTTWLTWDDNIGAVTEFAYQGTVTDVCAALS